MDKKDLRLAILASAILVGVPLIVNAIADHLSGRRYEHGGRDDPSATADSGGATHHLRGRPIEELAADLRRMRRALASDQHRSGVRQLANRIAYDQPLMQACEMLGLSHDLDKSSGPERDIERIRIEADLESAGIVLIDPAR